MAMICPACGVRNNNVVSAEQADSDVDAYKRALRSYEDLIVEIMRSLPQRSGARGQQLTFWDMADEILKRNKGLTSDEQLGG